MLLVTSKQRTIAGLVVLLSLTLINPTDDWMIGFVGIAFAGIVVTTLTGGLKHYRLHGEYLSKSETVVSALSNDGRMYPISSFIYRACWVIIWSSAIWGVLANAFDMVAEWFGAVTAMLIGFLMKWLP
ncbi:MAG: hypothetical protein AAFX00_06865 [Pseudomonadota bacterium]